MRTKKKFDPTKCPYQQMIEHNGVCILSVVVSIRDMHTGEYIYRTSRIRVLTMQSCYYNLVDSMERYDAFGRSCFSYDKRSRKSIVEAMRKYDSRGYRVVDIMFLPNKVKKIGKYEDND